jgi:hypothetical protein
MESHQQMKTLKDKKKNTRKWIYDTVRQAIQNIRYACWVTKATDGYS